MSPITAIVLALTILLMVYLAFALLYPENF